MINLLILALLFRDVVNGIFGDFTGFSGINFNSKVATIATIYRTVPYKLDNKLLKLRRYFIWLYTIIINLI